MFVYFFNLFCFVNYYYNKDWMLFILYNYFENFWKCEDFYYVIL